MGTAPSVPCGGSGTVDRTISSLNLGKLQYELMRSSSMPSPRRESSLSSSSKKSNSSTSTVIPPSTMKSSSVRKSVASGQGMKDTIDDTGRVCSDKSDSLRRYSVLVNQRGKIVHDVFSETSNSGSAATTERRCSSAKITGPMESSRRSQSDVSGLKTSSSRNLTPTPPSNLPPKSASSIIKVSPITNSKSLHNVRSSASSKSAPPDPSKSRESTAQSETPYPNEEAPSPILKLWSWVVSLGREPETTQLQNERGPLEEALRMFSPDSKWTGRVIFGKYKDESYTLRVVRIRGRQTDGAVKIQCRHKFKMLSGGVDVFVSTHSENPTQVLFRYGDHRAKFEGTLDVKTGQLVGSNVVLKNIMSKVPAGFTSTFALARAA